MLLQSQRTPLTSALHNILCFFLAGQRSEWPDQDQCHCQIRSLVFHFVFVSFNKICPFLSVCRLWLSNSALKNLRYRILDFDPRVLEGKIEVDPQKADTLKPVRMMLIIFCNYQICNQRSKPNLLPQKQSVIMKFLNFNKNKFPDSEICTGRFQIHASYHFLLLATVKHSSLQVKHAITSKILQIYVEK